MRRTTRKNARRHRSTSIRHLVRNVFGADLVQDVLVPVAGGAVGFLAVRALGNFAAQKNLPIIGTDPRAAKLAAALVAIPAIFYLAKSKPSIARNAGMMVLGAGLAPAEAYMNGMSLFGGTPAPVASAPAPTPTIASLIAPTTPGTTTAPAPTSGVGDYYSTLGMMYATAGADMGVDVSHAGAPYKGMLGLGDDPANQATIDSAMTAMENGSSGGSMSSVSTVTPTDVALQATMRPQVAKVTEPFADGDGRGEAGGVFARNLFAGMSGG